VFFTGGITAAIGLIILGHYGLVDLNLIYVNPTFIWSAVIGGLIMGLGFVIGGFCPGTSICAAAIGKVDAMFFVGGSFIGVLLFAEGYPVFETLFKAGAWGNIRMFDLLGISQELFAFLLVFMAITAFIATTIIEKRNNKGYVDPMLQPFKLYYGLAAITIVIGLSAFAFPERQTALKEEANNQELTFKASFEMMDSDELAFRIIDNDKTLQIFDFRKEEEYNEIKLPNSSNWTTDNLFGKDIHKKLAIKGMKNVIVTNNEEEGKKLGYIATELGYKDIYVLKGGMDEFKNEILNFKKPETVTRQMQATYVFREKARAKLPELIEANKKMINTGEKKTKRIIGGC